MRQFYFQIRYTKDFSKKHFSFVNLDLDLALNIVKDSLYSSQKCVCRFMAETDGVPPICVTIASLFFVRLCHTCGVCVSTLSHQSSGRMALGNKWCDDPSSTLLENVIYTRNTIEGLCLYPLHTIFNSTHTHTRTLCWTDLASATTSELFSRH